MSPQLLIAEAFVIERPVVTLTDAQRLTIILDRMRLTDPATGEVLWHPRSGGELEHLRSVIDRWAGATQTISVDPTNPLSYLLTECVCRRRNVTCPVHGPRRYEAREEFQARQKARSRPRREQIMAYYRETGDRLATALAFGISPQRVSQIVAQEKRIAATPTDPAGTTP